MSRLQELMSSARSQFDDLALTMGLVEAEIAKVVNPEDDPPEVPSEPPNDGGTFETLRWLGDWGTADQWLAGFLWKPISSNEGSLVVLLPGTIPHPDSASDIRISKVWLATNDLDHIEDLRYTGLANPVEGILRTHWRSHKRGDHFADGTAVVVEGTDGTRLIYFIGRPDKRNAGPLNRSGVFGTRDSVRVTTVDVWRSGSVPDVDPAPPPVLPGPPPPSPVGVPEVLQKPRLWIWREGSGAKDFGADQSVVVAPHGKAGAATVRLICRNGDPTVDVASMVHRSVEAKRQGCVAVCIDLESYFIRKGTRHAEEVYRQVSEVLPLIWAPKAYNDHLEKHWGFRGFEQGAAWLGKFGDGQIPWIYSQGKSDKWLDLYELTVKSGNDTLYVPLGDFAQRTSGGEYTSPFHAGVPSEFLDRGLGTGVFMPDSGQWTNIVMDTQVWASSLSVYG